MMLGIDTSAVDGNAPCDWNKVRAAGAAFVYLKKSQGLARDTCYARDSEAARTAGLVIGAYHFPSCGVAAASPKAQVAVFRGAPGTIASSKDLPPALDIEPGSAGWAATGRTKAELVELIRQFVLEIEDAFGCWPMIYTSYNQWNDLGLPAAPWAINCPLWLKTAYRLRARQPVDQIVPNDPHVGPQATDPRDHERVPGPWVHTGWAIQQFQGDAVGFPGASKTVDINRFNVTRRGSNGPLVSYLQRKFNRPAADGIFDGVLDSEVRVLQADHGLTADGIVGPATFAAISWLK